ncbi:hypothetical protein HMPREF9371_0816 [Neisseria shayeganii 871]|uniref:Uncharacterized protein n=1 Tax=Neisseria shayeganii 871 TaxID=1032488 RepID=G4CGS7_9NEIS|nr:hypothetical protein HMPREF9371_0816 [Neisseria shayeganii 871]
MRANIGRIKETNPFVPACRHLIGADWQNKRLPENAAAGRGCFQVA